MKLFKVKLSLFSLVPKKSFNLLLLAYLYYKLKLKPKSFLSLKELFLKLHKVKPFIYNQVINSFHIKQVHKKQDF